MSSSRQSFESYINAFYSKKGEGFTHTRIGDTQLGIKGGVYSIGNDNEEDAKMEAIENRLLYIQEDILENTAKTDLQNDEDFQIVKTLWLSAIDSKRDENLSVLDRLAVSLVKYTEQKN